MPPMTTPAPQLAAFPKAYMQALCRDGSMTLAEWIEEYINSRTDLASRTVNNLRQAQGHIVQILREDKLLRDVTLGDGDESYGGPC